MKWKWPLGGILIGLAALTSPLVLFAALLVLPGPVQCWEARPLELENSSKQALYLTFLARTHSGNEYPMLPCCRFALVERQKDIRLEPGEVFSTCYHCFTKDNSENDEESILVIARTEEGEYRQYRLGEDVWMMCTYQSPQIPAFPQMQEAEPEVLAQVRSLGSYDLNRLYIALCGLLPIALLIAGIATLKSADRPMQIDEKTAPRPSSPLQDAPDGSPPASGG